MNAREPATASSVAALLAGAVAVALVATTPGQRSALTLALGGFFALGAGLRLVRRDHRLLGGLLGLAGTGGVLLAALQQRTALLPLQLEFYPGLVGLALLTLGLAPVRRGWERPFVTAGAAAVFVAVVTSGVVQGSSARFLLLAGVAAVVSWDVGEQAVNLRDQVGSDARTWPVELTHGGATAVVGLGALGLSLLVADFDVTGVPLAGLAVLLVATLVLTAALYN